MQVTVARRAGNKGATRPVINTAANKAPTAWTHPDPLEWATPAKAAMATTLPTTGATQANGCTRFRSRIPLRVASGERHPGDRSPDTAELMWGGRASR